MPIFEPPFGHHLLTAWCYFQNTLNINPACQKQFQFFGDAFLAFRSRRACHNQAKLFTKCGTKNGPATQPHFWNLWGPFLWPFRNKVQWNWGAKIGSPKNTNWDPKVVPIFEPPFGHHLLTAWCYFQNTLIINPACQKHGRPTWRDRFSNLNQAPFPGPWNHAEVKATSQIAPRVVQKAPLLIRSGKYLIGVREGVVYCVNVL